jgi:hypothetical protein
MIFFSDLLDLIESNQELIEIIKRSYLKLFKCSTEMSDEMFLTQVKKASSYGSIIIAYSKEDNLEIDIVASAKLIIEPKITLYDKCIGQIEDMEICDRYKNGTLTNVLLDKVKAVAKSWDCIKLNMCCSMSDKIKCEKSGFHQNLIQMSIDIDNKDIVLAMLQSLSMKDYPSTMFDSFGVTIIDEVHHISSETFSNALFKNLAII